MSKTADGGRPTSLGATLMEMGFVTERDPERDLDDRAASVFPS